MISLAFRGNDGAQRARAVEVLSGLSFVSGVNQDNGKLVLTAQHGGQSLPQILRALNEAGVDVVDLTLTSPTLDDVFLKYTGERIREDTPVQNWRNARMPFLRPTRRRN
jgi:hypothetical protein